MRLEPYGFRVYLTEMGRIRKHSNVNGVRSHNGKKLPIWRNFELSDLLIHTDFENLYCCVIRQSGMYNP